MNKSVLIASSFNIVLSLYLLKLGLENKLLYYIHIRYTWLVIISVIFLLVLSILYTAYFLKHNPIRPKLPQVSFKLPRVKISFRLFSNALLSVFLVTLLLLPAKPLGTNININSANSISSRRLIINKNLKKPSIQKGIITNLSLQEWYQLVQNDLQLKTYKNQKLQISGFISNLQSDNFLISRYIVVCCAVDASPITLPVVYSDQSKQYLNNLKNDDWLKLTGYLSMETINNQLQPAIVLESSEQIPQPSDPYVYYN
jgi:putative membrane protein